MNGNLCLKPNITPSVSTNNSGGMLTKIWGPSMWVTLHTVSFDYPNKPTQEDKIKYRQFYESLAFILPCIYCRKSYTEFLKAGNTKLTDEIFDNTESLTKWVYYLHEAVNKKLGVDYGVTYDDVVKRYESYKANCSQKEKLPTDNKKGCSVPKDRKAQSFKIAHSKDCPIIPYKLARHFVEYAKERGIGDDEFYIIDLCHSHKYNKLDNLKEDKNIWDKRNKECCEITLEMQTHGIHPLEASGKYKDLPTVNELKLIIRLSSNLNKDKLIQIAKQLTGAKCEYSKIYKLIK